MKNDDVFAKCAWRLIPFIALLYVVNYIDRVNVGFAALTMNKDLGFSPVVYGFGAGVFQISYGLFHVPAAILVTRTGVRRTIFWFVFLWGLISAANAFVHDAPSFYVVRILLGVAEAGVFPGLIYYLTLWFPSPYRARCISGLWSGVPMAIVIAGPLSSLILGMDGLAGLHGWQWLFIMEAIPAILLSFAVLRLLPDSPHHAAWLNPVEKEKIAACLAMERAEVRHDLWRALRDPRVIGLGVVSLGWSIGFYGLVLWVPQIVQSMGISNSATGFIVAAPYLVGIGSAMLWAASSDAKNERVWHGVFALLLAGAGFTVASVAPFNLLVLAGLGVATIGMCAAVSPLFSLPSSFLSATAAAGAVALINAIGRIGGFLGPIIIGLTREQTGGYAASMLALALALLLAAFIPLTFGRGMTQHIAVAPAKAGGAA